MGDSSGEQDLAGPEWVYTFIDRKAKKLIPGFIREGETHGFEET